MNNFGPVIKRFTRNIYFCVHSSGLTENSLKITNKRRGEVSLRTLDGLDNGITLILWRDFYLTSI